MTVDEYLAKAERYRVLKERAHDRFSQHLFARWSEAIGPWPNATRCFKSRIGSRKKAYDVAASPSGTGRKCGTRRFRGGQKTHIASQT
jgi:hypothetical protein